MIKFEWDDVKASKNSEKHGVSFEEATTVFYDDFALQFFDKKHSQLKEDRFLLLGMSSQSRVLMAVFVKIVGIILYLFNQVYQGSKTPRQLGHNF